MSKKLYDEEKIRDIAEAIREQNGTQNQYILAQMPGAIRSIHTDPNLETLIATPSAAQKVIEPGIGYDGFSSVTVEGVVAPNLIAANIKKDVVVKVGTATDDDSVMTVTGSYEGGSVAPVLQEKTATTNGEVTPDTGYDGLSKVTVNVPSGGGGGDIPLLTKSAWDALTTVQKQAYGLVAIQEVSYGFVRGNLVNGADYHPTGLYLPYSNFDNVICEAYGSNYDSSSLSWGYGDNPITLSATGSVRNADGSVSIMTKTNGTLAYVDFGASSTVFTAYFIGKIKNASSFYTRLLSCMNTRVGGQGIILYGNTVAVSSWGNDTSTGVDANNYFVGVIQFAGPGTGLGAAISASGNTPKFINKTPYVAGQYLTIGRSDINPSASNAEPTDMDVLYLGVVNIAEDTSTIANNMEYLAQQFLS